MYAPRFAEMLRSQVPVLLNESRLLLTPGICFASQRLLDLLVLAAHRLCLFYVPTRAR